MPKSTNIYTTRDPVSTDKKFRLDDENLYAKEKQEFQGSEKGKRSESRSEAEFLSEQDKNEQDKNEQDKNEDKNEDKNGED